jgi:tetratricopeptide (TPR) repeat protein
LHDARGAYERLTANLWQSRGERNFAGEFAYGYGILLETLGRFDDAGAAFRESAAQAREAARRVFVPRVNAWVGCFMPNSYSPASSPTTYRADENFATLSGAATWQPFAPPDSGIWTMPKMTVADLASRCYALFIYEGAGEEVIITYPAGAGLHFNGVAQDGVVDDDGYFSVTTRMNAGANFALLALPPRRSEQKFVFAVEDKSWATVNAFGLLARFDETVAAFLLGDLAATRKLNQKLRADNVPTLLRERYSQALRSRAPLMNVWQRMDELLTRAAKAPLTTAENDLTLAVEILTAWGELNDEISNIEIAKRYLTAALLYANGAQREESYAEKMLLLYHAEKILAAATDLCPQWAPAALAQAELAYRQDSYRGAAREKFAAILTQFPENIEARQELARFYLRADKIDLTTGEKIPAEPARAKLICENLLTLTGGRTAPTLTLYTETLLALGQYDQAWIAANEAKTRDESPQTAALVERVRQAMLATADME